MKEVETYAAARAFRRALEARLQERANVVGLFSNDYGNR